jgi:NADPH:quinone reductase-like Zn-dependent oxidoreductase
MKAVVLHETKGPRALCLEEVATPEPGPGEVRVALRAAALNHREVWITVAKYPGIRLPCILGADGAGLVDKLGAGVDAALRDREVVIYPARDWGEDSRFPSPAFRVLGMPDPGTFAQYICVPAEHALPKPVHLTWEQAAALPLAGLTAWRAAITQAAVKPGDNVLVTGIGGGVATFALKWAVAREARVFVTSGDPDKIERARRLGAAAGVSYRSEHWGRELTEVAGSGMDAIVDGTGGPGFAHCFNALNPGGRLVAYGATAGNPPQGLDMVRLFFRQVQIRGSTMGTPDEFSAMLSFVEQHRIEPVIDRVFSLQDAIEAHLRMQAGNQMGKIILRVTG